MAIEGSAEIKFVVGEAYVFSLAFEGDTADLVSEVKISCNRLGFCHDLKNESGRWTYFFSEEETKEFPPCKTYYSITVRSLVEQLDPQILVNQKLEVIANNNPACC